MDTFLLYFCFSFYANKTLTSDKTANINNVSVQIVTESITDSYNFENFELSCE